MKIQIIELNEQNLTDTLQLSQQIPLVIVFYAPSHEISQNFTALLENFTDRYQGQFVLAKVNCETCQTLAM